MPALKRHPRRRACKATEVSPTGVNGGLTLHYRRMLVHIMKAKLGEDSAKILASHFNDYHRSGSAPPTPWECGKCRAASLYSKANKATHELHVQKCPTCCAVRKYPISYEGADCRLMFSFGYLPFHETCKLRKQRIERISHYLDLCGIHKYVEPVDDDSSHTIVIANPLIWTFAALSLLVYAFSHIL